MRETSGRRVFAKRVELEGEGEGGEKKNRVKLNVSLVSFFRGKERRGFHITMLYNYVCMYVWTDTYIRKEKLMYVLI